MPNLIDDTQELAQVWMRARLEFLLMTAEKSYTESPSFGKQALKDSYVA